MKYHIAIVILLLLSLVSHSQTDPIYFSTDSLDDYFLTHPEFSGNILMTYKGQVIYEKSFGFANHELSVPNSDSTKFNIGSNTKQFTAMCIMILQEKGLLNTSDSLHQYFEQYPELWNNLTIHQLLTHTSGLMHSWDLEEFRTNKANKQTIEEVLEMFYDEPLFAEPDSVFHYSGLAYFILSELIERVSGMEYCQFLQSEVFTKIGMLTSGCNCTEDIIPNRASGYTFKNDTLRNADVIYLPILTGGGNLYSTTHDMIKWKNALLNNTLISAQTFNQMTNKEKDDYAYGLYVIEYAGDRIITHSGAIPGFLTLIDIFPEYNFCTVIMSNCVRHKNPEIRGKLSSIAIREIKRKLQ